ncbi:DUF4252 domain-containing protein [Maribacter confluentis]|uniref:DUF4252 domain-containing protein n=1 Tax=Maribacter confluentis TaxID=1656093 RepID=A0ABT8RK03_9FLAO|nr:DUF4252 domain-containing protein [Maribacter confluentis]MDO1511324.1 DUF4252 domain-containing protein [Maribacter confluentis]
MKNIKRILVVLLAVAVTSCSSEQSLQQYFVANAENPNFMSFDIPASIFNVEKANLSETQAKTANSLKKLNILAFKKNEVNAADYETQKVAIKNILKGGDFSELMKMNTSFGKATIQLKGDDDSIDEIVIYGDNDEKGLILVRVLGDDMNPASFVQLLQAMEKSDFNGEGLEQLGSFFKG